MRALAWALRAFVFFALFAFALNNQQTVTVHWFFGAQWAAPMVIVVMAAFAAGCAIGVVAMVPAWWRQRRQVRPTSPAHTPPPSPAPAEGPALAQPPRDGL